MQMRPGAGLMLILLASAVASGAETRRANLAGPATPHVPAIAREEILRVRDILVRDFTNAGSLAALTSLVLQYHTGRDAVILSDRLAAWHDAFVHVLRRLPAR